jgi:hypothetical protein
MRVELSDDIRRYIESELAAGHYRTPAELIRNLIHRQKKQDAGDRRLWKKQRRALHMLLDKMATLPTPGRDHGLSNRDHDRILYGGKE